jgi:small subunit ribosomal protein S3
MGQKVHPYGFRLGVIKTWNSKWFEERNYASWLHEDITLRRLVKEHLANAGLAGVEIERAAAKVKIVIYTARPGYRDRQGRQGRGRPQEGQARRP